MLNRLWSALAPEVDSRPLPITAKLRVWPDPLVVGAVGSAGVVWRHLATTSALAPAVAAFFESGMARIAPEPRKHLAQIIASGRGVLVIDADPVHQSAAAVLVTAETSLVVFSLRPPAN